MAKPTDGSEKPVDTLIFVVHNKLMKKIHLYLSS